MKTSKTSDQALVGALRAWVTRTGADLSMGPGDAPLADVVVWDAQDAHRRDWIRGPGAVTLVYEGAGYDYLSPQADYPQISALYREQLRSLAASHGYYMEDANSWSACFYRE